MDNNTTQTKIDKDRHTNIPAELKALGNWILYNKDKEPKNPATRGGAMPNKASTWTTYAAALAALTTRPDCVGLGFMFGEADKPCGYFGVDLDHVIDDAGNLDDKARQIMDTLNSYTEISPSGHGLHIICKGSLPACGHRNGVEMYDRLHYFTVTGNSYGSPRPIAERTSEGAIIYEAYLKRHEPAGQTTTAPTSTPARPVELSDRELLEKMFKSQAGGDVLERLYRGDWQTDYNTPEKQSPADFAFCKALAFWTNKDAGRIDRIFRTSGLMRDKWDRKTGGTTYGAMTIQRAIDAQPSGYTGARPDRQAPAAAQNTTAETKQPTTAETAAPKTAATPKTEQAAQNDTEADKLPHAKPLVPVSNYVPDGLDKDITDHAKYKNRLSGYNNIDAVHGALYSGLYVLGGTSSLGKTTLLLQMCDQLAAAGEHCIYFSLEQNKMELVTKSLSRITYELDPLTAVTATQIKNGEGGTALIEAMETYRGYANRIAIIDGAMDIDIEVIKDTVKQAIINAKRDNQPRPVVFVDYLQIIQPTEVGKLTGRDKIDDITRELKKLQTQNDLLMFVVSSFNRSNYMNPVDYESFKESGGIEYTADVLWGLQLQVIKQVIFDEAKDKKISEKRALIRKAKQELPRAVELVCLKNRYGSAAYSAQFKYNQKYDAFTPDGHDRGGEVTPASEPPETVQAGQTDTLGQNGSGDLGESVLYAHSSKKRGRK